MNTDATPPPQKPDTVIATLGGQVATKTNQVNALKDQLSGLQELVIALTGWRPWYSGAPRLYATRMRRPTDYEVERGIVGDLNADSPADMAEKIRDQYAKSARHNFPATPPPRRRAPLRRPPVGPVLLVGAGSGADRAVTGVRPGLGDRVAPHLEHRVAGT